MSRQSDYRDPGLRRQRATLLWLLRLPAVRLARTLATRAPDRGAKALKDHRARLFEAVEADEVRRIEEHRQKARLREKERRLREDLGIAAPVAPPAQVAPVARVEPEPAPLQEEDLAPARRPGENRWLLIPALVAGMAVVVYILRIVLYLLGY